MTTNELLKLRADLSSRYGVALEGGYWDEVRLEGGIAMSPSDFLALTNAAEMYGDLRATVYEMESLDTRFPPFSIDLAYEPFRQLKGNVVSHFDLALVPPSKQWAALLTSELETLVFGAREFLARIGIQRNRTE